jgi:hypothetical protein
VSQLLIPTSALGQCPECQQAILSADTPRISKGRPVTVWLDPQPDSSGRYIVSPPGRKGGRWQAGLLRANQAAGARDNGQQLYSDHKVTCPKRSTPKR